MAGPFDLTGQNIENTYQRILQTPDGVNVYDGTGSAFTVTAVINTSSLVTTSSFNAFTASINTFTSSYNTGSFSGSFSGSFYGTASWAQSASQAISSSYALTASYALNGGVTSINIAGTGLSINQTTGAVIITGTGGGGGNTATGSYGSFYSTVTQTNVASTARSMSLNTTDISNGVSISGSTNPFNTYIKTENPGVYDIQFSAQVDKTDSGTDEIWIWLRKNGVNVTDSATSIQLVGNGAHYIAAWNFFVNAAANDYFQLMWYSPDANVRLHAEPAFGVVPGIPSLIVTVNRVDQFLSNTGSFSGSFTGVFTGSLFGTSSWATNAQTSSNGFPYTGSAIITGSLLVSGGFVVCNSTNGNKAIDSALSNLYYSDGDVSVGWADSQLRDTNNDVSINWNERTLFADDNETTHIDWSNPSYIKFPNINITSSIVNILGLDSNNNLYITSSTAFGGGISGQTTVGTNLITQPNPSAIRYMRIDANNGISQLTVAQLQTDLGMPVTVVKTSNNSTPGSSTAWTDITDLSFNATAGVLYEVRMVCILDSPTIGNGVKLGVSSSVAPSLVSWVFRVAGNTGNTAYQTTVSPSITYDGATAAAAVAFTTSNIGILEGFIQLSSNGTVNGRFGNEVATGAATIHTCKSGSFIQYRQIS